MPLLCECYYICSHCKPIVLIHMNTNVKSSRLLSLDVMRGITIAGMIMVNNPGSWSSVYAPLRHASWNGITPTDLVFPFFMFMMGVAVYFSLSKSNFSFDKKFYLKLVKRSVLLFLIGLVLNWFGGFVYNLFRVEDGLSFADRMAAVYQQFESLRILGVLQRLALAYFFAVLIMALTGKKYVWPIIAVLLGGYTLALYLGNGFELSDTSIIAIVDNSLLGSNHIYRLWHPENGAVAFDPEGLFSTIPSIAHVLIGFYAGRLILDSKTIDVKIEKLLMLGTCLLFVGYLLSYGCPINKSIWSPTFVLVTCGAGAQLLGFLMWVIDVKGRKKWAVPFESFGVNPLFLYVLAAVLSVLFSAVPIPVGGGNYTSIHGLLFDGFAVFCGNPYLSSLLYALTFVSTNWVIGNVLYKRRIFIKL